MKKILGVALVALLASSMAFAGFSGSAKVGFGYNIDSKDYGFIDNSTNVKFNIDLATASAEKIAEGDVYASIKASLAMFVLTKEAGVTPADPLSFGFAKLPEDDKTGIALALKAKINEAKVAGKDWYISLLGVPSQPDFAKSAIDSWTVSGDKDDYGLTLDDYTKYASYKPGYFKAPGIEAAYADYKIGFGIRGNATEGAKKLATTAYALTPNYEVVEGLKIQAGATYAYANGLVAADKDNYGTDADKNVVAGSVKVAYENDTFSVSTASDMGYDIKAEKFDADVAAKLSISPVTVDAYYATNVKVDSDSVKNLLSAKAVVDLKAFDIPVTLTVTGKDLVNKQNLSAKVAFNITKELSASVSGGYVINTKVWNVGGDVKYAVDAFTVKAATAVKKTVDTDNMLLSASIESSVLVPGATLTLAWSGAKDLLDKVASQKKNYGKVIASCKVAF